MCVCHGFVGNRHTAGSKQRGGLLLVRGQMQIGHQHLARPQQGVFAGLQLFNLDDQVGLPIDLLSPVDNRCPGAAVDGIILADAVSSPRLYQHRVTTPHRLLDARGGQAHTEFVGLHFFWDPDQHRLCLLHGSLRHS